MAPYLIRIIFILLSTPPSHCFHSAAIQRHTFTKFSKNPNNSEIELDETLKKQAQFFGGSSEKDEFLTTEALAFESQLGAESPLSESNQSNRFAYKEPKMQMMLSFKKMAKMDDKDFNAVDTIIYVDQFYNSTKSKSSTSGTGLTTKTYSATTTTTTATITTMGTTTTSTIS